MENEIRRPIQKKKRRILWGRMLIFIVFIVMLVAALGLGIYNTCVVAKDTYQSWVEVVDEFQQNKQVEKNFQDEKFNQYTNVLIMGIDDGDPGNLSSGRRADTMIIASIRHTDGFIHFLAIPRNTKVSIPGRKPEEMINQAYYYGGAQLSVRTVEQFLQIPIHHYVVIDGKAFIELIDTLGGVQLYVESDMNYEDPYAQFTIHLKKGYQHLGGHEAGQYVRYRSDELGDIGRVQRQKKFIKAIYAQLVQMDTITKLPEIIDIINRRVTTSMAMLDTAQTVKNLNGFNPELIKSEMLPGKNLSMQSDHYWIVDQGALVLLLEGMFSAENTVSPETPTDNSSKQ